MYPEPHPVAPEGYDTWSPRMGRGGRVVVWVILAMIAVGSGMMAWQAWAAWAAGLGPGVVRAGVSESAGGV